LKFDVDISEKDKNKTNASNLSKIEKEKLLTDIGSEKLKFPEVQEITNSLRAGLSRDEVLSLCLDIANSKKSEEHVEIDPEDDNTEHHVTVEDFDT